MATVTHTSNHFTQSVSCSPDASLAQERPLTFVDLFCGIGGFHLAAKNIGLEAVFACDIDSDAREAYERNFGLLPKGDICNIKESAIPEHDLLFAGFPCQPFSIIGERRGFSDPRGTLFFEVARILKAKKPAGVVLENVKQIATAQKGLVLKKILDELAALGYSTDYKILNALDFGLPQKRERVIVVATLTPFEEFPWPTEPVPMKPLSEILDPNPDAKHRVSQRILEKRRASHTAEFSPAIWHENKAGNISSHPWSCALRAGASHNYLLVDGERRPTPRELLRLQGFPDSYSFVNDAQTRKQAGNAVPVPLVQAVVEKVANVIREAEAKRFDPTPFSYP